MSKLSLITLVLIAWANYVECTWSGLSKTSRVVGRTLLPASPLQIRGGETAEDEERYSRQVYTLGTRAHGLVRSSTVYLDGPPTSGLVYECAKNLALSGVRRLVIVRSKDNIDTRYHNSELDDLGQSYQRAARAELKEWKSAPPEEILMEYLKRLNPSVLVSIADRFNFQRSSESSRGVILCMDRPYATQVSLNHAAREHGLSFVAVETAGVFGRAFCDFGPSFEVYDADGETPLLIPLDRIEASNEDGTVVVHCVEGEKHDVSKGDMIQFQLRNGEHAGEQCKVVDVQSPFRFEAKIGDGIEVGDFMQKINSGAAAFSRIKIPQEISFEIVDKATEAAKSDSSLFTPCDLDKSFDTVRRSASFSCFQALSAFVDENGRLPDGDNNEDTGNFVELALKVWTSERDADTLQDKVDHIQSFLHGCAAKFSPFQAVFGAIGAQEALKAATGLYFPVRQFLFYDCDEVLRPESQASKTDAQPELSACSATGLRRILGDSIVNDLQAKRLFVVGAGAIGCEILKNLASMGAGTGKSGSIVLTDMDTIEKSNLSRQLLFRDTDIGKFKSAAAHDATLRFNPRINMETHSSKVGGSGHSPFNEHFWSKKVDIVLNALDNVEARLYIDGQCVANGKGLVDAGTMGPKGNVQVIVPFKSESYSSSVDPPEAAIAVCTLKNFPYAISHTIQWARDMFDGLFLRRPNQANDFMDSLASSSVSEVTVKLIRDLGEETALQIAEELSEDVAIANSAGDMDLPAIRASALQWAAELASQLFHQSTINLFRQHPLDSLDEDGEPFWSGTRRPPRPLSHMACSPEDKDQRSINANLIEFVRNAARLRVESLLDSGCAGGSLFSAKEATDVLSSSDTFGICEKDGNERQSDSNQPVAARIRANLNPLRCGSRKLAAVEFEKDDDSNGHVAFVTAASNLRAISYGIPPVDAMETRRVAGNIVPAMITTTAFVSALSCIELVKLVQNRPLRSHRNAFINLALPFFAFTAPLPAEQILGLRGRQYTLWDRLSVKEGKKSAKAGGLTMKSLVRRIKKKACVEPESIDVSSISLGPYMLFANFLHEGDESLMSKSVWEVIDETLGSREDFDEENSREVEEDLTIDFSTAQNHVDLTVVVEDLETGDEFELPLVRVERHKK